MTRMVLPDLKNLDMKFEKKKKLKKIVSTGAA